MKITLYQSADMSITPGKIWLAHMDLGSSLFMSFFGATEEAALERANAWYEGERKKYDRKEGNGPIVGAETRVDEVYPINESAVISKESWDNLVPKSEWSGNWLQASDGSETVREWRESDNATEHRLTGSVWVLNRATGHRARIAADQLASYEEKGYIRSGPRGK